MYKPKLIAILSLIFLILLDSIVIADNIIPAYIRGRDKETTYDFTFNFTSDSGCNNVLKSIETSITTDINGIGFASLNISDLTIPPSYMCEYQNNVLIAVHTWNDILTNTIYVGYIYAEGILINAIFAADILADDIRVADIFKIKDNNTREYLTIQPVDRLGLSSGVTLAIETYGTNPTFEIQNYCGCNQDVRMGTSPSFINIILNGFLQAKYGIFTGGFAELVLNIMGADQSQALGFDGKIGGSIRADLGKGGDSTETAGKGGGMEIKPDAGGDGIFGGDCAAGGDFIVNMTEAVGGIDASKTCRNGRAMIIGNFNVTGNITYSGIYADLSDLKDQTFSATNTPQPINLTTTDEIYGLSVSIYNITIQRSGLYFIFPQPQIAAGAGQSGYLHMWLEKHDTIKWINISNSNTEFTLTSQGEQVGTLAKTRYFNVNEKIRVMASVSSTGIFLDAKTPVGEPAIPSIIYTMYKVGD